MSNSGPAELYSDDEYAPDVAPRELTRHDFAVAVMRSRGRTS